MKWWQYERWYDLVLNYNMYHVLIPVHNWDICYQEFNRHFIISIKMILFLFNSLSDGWFRSSHDIIWYQTQVYNLKQCKINVFKLSCNKLCVVPYGYECQVRYCYGHKLNLNKFIELNFLTYQFILLLLKYFGVIQLYPFDVTQSFELGTIRICLDLLMCTGPHYNFGGTFINVYINKSTNVFNLRKVTSKGSTLCPWESV